MKQKKIAKGLSSVAGKNVAGVAGTCSRSGREIPRGDRASVNKEPDCEGGHGYAVAFFTPGGSDRIVANPWSNEQLEAFRAAAQSLKLYRRAELEDENQRSLIKDLYVDPLPANHVFQTVLKPHTTLLIGREGTGKSTIFQRVQYELRHMNGYASAYVDIKTVFEAAST